MTDENARNNEETAEDVVFENTIEGEGEAYSQDKIKKLREDLKKATAEKADYLAQWQKERADFLNYKKSEDDRRKDTLNYAREGFAEELLPVLDAYDMMRSNKEQWDKVESGWRTGVEYIQGQLLKVLADNGIAEISPKEGDKPDANQHDLIETVETDDNAKDHTIAQVLQKGYRIKDRVIRPARVKVYEVKK